MNEPECKKCCPVIPTLAILGSFLVVGWLACLMIRSTRPEPLGQERANERRKALTDVRAADAQALKSYGWQDQSKGIVRLPVDRAMELTLQEWKDPAAGRKELLSRLDKATAAPPKAPEKPSQFE
jgi:hypothetical protein